MSHILKIALCPAPFQKSKKKGDKKKDKKASPAELHFQQILPASLVPSFGSSSDHHHHARPSSISPRSSMSSGSPQQPLRSAYSHQGDTRAIVVPPPTVHEGGDGSCRGTVCSYSRGGYQTSGYQSDYYHCSSSYGDNGGSFEAQVLARATKDKPANLRMTAIRDYSPGCNEELSVRKGQRVRVMYRNHDWVFAVTKHGHSGFIPFSYVRPSRKYNGYQSEPEIARVDDSYISGYETDVTNFPFPPPTSRPSASHQRSAPVPATYSINTGCRRVGSGSPMQMHVDSVFDSGYMSAIEGPTYHHHTSTHSTTSRYRPTTVKPSVDSFPREFIEEIVVIHDFEAKEEDEVFVSKGERVRVLNATDPNWLWVVTTRMGEEGFIPRSCCTLGNHPSLSSPDFQNSRTRRQADHLSSRRQHPAHHYPRHHQHHRNMRTQAKDRFKQLAMIRNTDPTAMDKEEIKRVGTKLIVLMDYEAVMSDELSVEFAETLLADVLSQNGVDRIWVYCPRTDTCGYVPMSMVVPPVV